MRDISSQRDDMLTADPMIVGGNVSSSRDNGSTDNDDLDRILPVTHFIVFYSLDFIMSLVGNGLLCQLLVQQKDKKKHTSYRILLFNLAISDVLTTVFCIPFAVIPNNLLHYWPFGVAMCRFTAFMQTYAVMLNSFTLIGLAIERYLCLRYPKSNYTPKESCTRGVLFVLGIWMTALLPPIPGAMQSGLVLPSFTTHGAYCLETWRREDQRYAYGVSLMLLQYFIPLVVLLYTCVHICHATLCTYLGTRQKADNAKKVRLSVNKMYF
jgi:hypothetical protein